MLILSRKKGDGIILDDKIKIKILETSDGKVKIGIDAPDDVRILRAEVKEQIIEQNKSATDFVVGADELRLALKNQKK